MVMDQEDGCGFMVYLRVMCRDCCPRNALHLACAVLPLDRQI